MQVFKYRSVNQPTSVDSFRTTTAQFGDGYEQSAGDGINGHKQTWNLEFAGRHVLEIRRFLIAHRGYRSFQWTNPFGEVGIYRLQGGINSKHHGNKVVSLTCQFIEVVKP